MTLFSFAPGGKAGWIAAGMASALLGFGCWWFHGQAVTARESAAEWQRAVREVQLALNEAMTAREALEKALTEHRARVREVESQSAKLRAKIQEAASHDQTVRDWSDKPLPDAVRGLLQSR